MSATDLVIARLATEEGFRATAYRDTVGRLTIGYGFNVDAGITQGAARALLAAQVTEICAALAQFSWWPADDARQSVLLDLAFNNGIHGLLGYVHMLAAIARQDWQGAHDEILNSEAARLLPGRYTALANILLTGNTLCAT